MPDLADRLNSALAGRYAIQRELGRGGMATVFLADDLKHRRSVALKVLHPELAAVIGSERFLREIETAAALNHPHILPLHDSGNADGLLFYVMPYVEGESLRSRLTRERQLPIPDALQLAGQVASALDYAHRRGVVHRDIKPENILLSDGQAVVADFGIARAIAAAGDSNLTATGITLGTPMYMSPEQAIGSQALDGRSDLYSLGCVLYEMLSGQPPFTGPVESLMYQHGSLAPRPVSALRATVPNAVDRALETALAKLPADRFGTASGFATALATTEPAAAPPRSDEAPSPKRILPGRRRGLVLVATSVTALVLALALWQWGPWRGPATPAKRAWMLVAEFDGPPADSALTTATRDLMAAALDQSEIVAVVPPDQIRVALQMAGRPASTRVDAELARELAYRSSVRTVLEGRIGRLGTGYSVVLRVVDVDSARVVVSLSDMAKDEQALIPAVNRIARKLRAELGERRAAIQATRDLGTVTTPSLEVFKTMMAARTLLFRNDNRGAIAMARNALAHDPQCSSAWAVVGFGLTNLGEADSAMHAFIQALARPERMTQAQEMFAKASLATLSGDYDGELIWYDQLVLMYPERMAVHNNRGAVLYRAGRLAEAVESFEIAEKVSPVSPAQQTLNNKFQALLALGRIDEAREIASRLTGSLGLRAPLLIAMATGQWSTAESLASALRTNPAAYEDHQLEAEWVVAAAQASSGHVGAAAATLRAVQSEAERSDHTVVANQARWRRLMLALFSRGVDASPGDAGRWDSTTFGLVTRGAWAAAAGDTASALQSLTTVRSHSAPQIARQAFTPAIVQALIDARAGRSHELIRGLGPAALQGEPRGYSEFNSATLLRWLVAEAYDQLGQPDSAAAYFERAIAPPPAGGLDFEYIRMASPFGHQRLVLLYARMGRPEDARRHWRMLTDEFAHAGPELAPMVEEARSALGGALVAAPTTK